jgi:hypothetical protein
VDSAAIYYKLNTKFINRPHISVINCEIYSVQSCLIVTAAIGFRTQYRKYQKKLGTYSKTVLGKGVTLYSLGTFANIWPLVPASGWCGPVHVIRIGNGKQSTWRKPALIPLCSLQIPPYLTWD